MQGVVATATLLLAVTIGAMQLHSSDFTQGGVIPMRAMASDCGGENRSPALRWSGAPSGTKSFALVVHDPDAPLPGGFYHWVVYNLPASSNALAAGVRLASQQLGETSNGRIGYYGPCPPPGPAHHYTFTLYALDAAHLSTDAALTATQLERRIAGHVLDRTALAGTAYRH